MSLARFGIMLGLVLVLLGGFFYLWPGTFIFSSQINAFVSTYGSFILPGLKSNPALAGFVEKSPAILCALAGLLLVLVGIAKSR